MAQWNNKGYAYGGFTLDGTRYRPPLRGRRGRRIRFNADTGSQEYKEATRAEERARIEAEKGNLKARKKTKAFAGPPFTKAAERYLEERKHVLAGRASELSRSDRATRKPIFAKRALTVSRHTI